MIQQKNVKDNEEQQYNLNNFNYKQIQSSITKQRFYSFAFNTNLTILFIGSSQGKIKIYGFNNKLKQVQTLESENYEFIFKIFFLKKINQLVTSTHANCNIIIWNLDRNNFWRVKQSWNAHQKFLNCLIINNNENMLISGGMDRKIKFWKKEHLGWSCIQTIETQEMVTCLSLNTSQTKLIGSEGKLKIQVIELQPDQRWIITQTIDVKDGYRLGFVNDNSFVLQPTKMDVLKIYQYDQEKKQFNKHQKWKLPYDIYF